MLIQILNEIQWSWLLKYLTVYILIDLFNEEMSDARSGKSKLIKVSEVLNDYRNQIFNSVKGGKSCEEEKKEFDVIVLKLQEWITTLELEKDDLEQYGCQAV